MIGWVIEAIKSSKCFDKIFVSTDCKEVASISKEFGADVPFFLDQKISQMIIQVSCQL